MKIHRQSKSQARCGVKKTQLAHSLIKSLALPDGVDDQSFNPYDYLSEGEKLDKKFVSHAALADTVDEIEAVRKQYARETTDRETIQKGGAMSFLVGLGVVGVADPINLIPIGGAIAKTYKAGNSVLDAASCYR